MSTKGNMVLVLEIPGFQDNVYIKCKCCVQGF